MNSPTSLAAQRVLDAVSDDANCAQLRTRLNDLETKLVGVQDSITADLKQLQDALKIGARDAAEASDRDLATLDVDLIVRPRRSIEALREQIRQQRMAEAELAEAVRIVRNRLRNREDVAFDEAHQSFLVPEQLAIGGKVVDQMLTLIELWLAERALRRPFALVAGRFERADIWATFTVDPGHVRDLIERLERRGYQATAEQKRRLQAVQQAFR